MGETLNASDTIISARNMAVKSSNRTKELIPHSDRVSQYASYGFTHILKITMPL